MTTDPGDPRIERGMSRQLEDRRRRLTSGARHVGWKAGFGAPAALQRFGLAGPLVGYLTDATLSKTGTSVPVGGWVNPVAEPELAVHMGPTCPGGAEPPRSPRPSPGSALRSSWPTSTRHRTTSRRSLRATYPPRRRAGYARPRSGRGKHRRRDRRRHPHWCLVAADHRPGGSDRSVARGDRSHCRHPGRVRGRHFGLAMW